MPELPEVETMVRGIREQVEGASIRDVLACECPCKPIQVSPAWPEFHEKLVGARIEAVSRFAKRIILHTGGESGIAIEPRMTGLMLLADPPDVGHLRIEWRLQKSRTRFSLWFWDRRGLGTVRFYDNLSTLRDSLGPDALCMTETDWRPVCKKTKREIKVLLLDQKAVAGIGNLYASEILHLAGIHPQKPADRLTKSQIGKLSAAVQTVLHTAIEHEGSTLSDGTYRNALNQNGSYQNEHRVYQKHDEPCSNCSKGTIQRIVQAQRSTFFCPSCQRK